MLLILLLILSYSILPDVFETMSESSQLNLLLLYVYIHVCIHTCMYTYMYVYIHVCIHTCMYTYKTPTTKKALYVVRKSSLYK